MKWLFLWASVCFLAGCATYKQDIDAGLSLAKEGEWKAAEEKLEGVLNNPQDKLLYYMEAGALAQNQGDFERSNTLLEQAEKLSDTFFPENFSNRSWALLTNPRQSDYRGSGIEGVYISYLKSLNYLALAEQEADTRQKRQLQDAALVEVRRIDIKLNEIRAQNPSYQDLNAKENQAFYMKALSWLGNFYTGGRDTDKFIYRDDAWARYMEGLQYEISGEYDDARISYQKAANLYQDGYAKQYDLPAITAERAWLDTIRMMQKSGYSQDEIQQHINTKLSPAMQETLKQYHDGESELVILEHQGFIPDKSEMTLLLYADPRAYSLVLEPLHGGGTTQANDSFRWFTMVYADINPLNLIANYKAGGAWGTFSGIFTKRVILGRPVWQQLSATHVDKLLTEQPIRVTVPYYGRFTLDQHQPTLQVSTEAVTPVKNSIRMTSLADIAFQEQLAQAQRDIYEGLVRELLRSWLAYQVSSNVQDKNAALILNLIGQVAVFASSAADTRNWLTLPAQVRLTRTPLPPGEYTPDYQVNQKTFSLGKVHLEANKIKVWNLRNPN
ncbi:MULTISPECIES: hypothetical protein [Marinomonas]|uniref:Tetratricopeptide repeat protein n=1 Tax=Marinomonas arctica TaxID=383750 RepID=A0A7H1J591_9GAMM|nr:MULTISPECIES: hypothetical protein [Marinomonas]MCS7486361.1 hypothetical protein [Marinomonas sp. BSi20414]QNT05657.1 hypothetical protein IBG28_18700 [Marinomonas arctica]GGN29633.1 hypothetical protein GCM10011350_22000 [Marinomonas arctica]